MNVITSVSDKYFLLNDVRYVRNYLSKPYGNTVEIYNCYDRKDVLVTRTNYNNFTVNGVMYSSVAALQAALLDVIYNRNFGASGSSAPAVKPIKTITSSSTGFSGNTYTLQPDDDKKWLMFNLPSAFTILIPAGVFAAGAEFEGHIEGLGQATFEGGNGVSRDYSGGYVNKIHGRYSVFGIKFRTASQVLIFGELALS
ncbi:MAG: hypothetical protein ACO1N9_05610 [Flavobacterium sp.]